MTKPSSEKPAACFSVALAERWRALAASLEMNGAPVQAEVLVRLAAEMEAESRLFALEALTLEAAAAETGYGYSAIQKKVASGELDNVGRKGSPRVRRGDLPRKGRREHIGVADAILRRRAL